MTLSANDHPGLAQDAEQRTLRERLGSLLREYARQPKRLHLAPAARLHRCARCGLTGPIGRLLRHRSMPAPLSGYAVVCRDGLRCSCRRAERATAQVVPSAAEPMAVTLAAYLAGDR